MCSSSSTIWGSTTRLGSVELGPWLLTPLDKVPSKRGAHSSGNGDAVFPGDICRPGNTAKRQKSVRRGINSGRFF
ncbi:hypothetical protein Tco_0278753 [Tanacetum coccineum]